jgi:hypothetical protein
MMIRDNSIATGMGRSFASIQQPSSRLHYSCRNATRKTPETGSSITNWIFSMTA